VLNWPGFFYLEITCCKPYDIKTLVVSPVLYYSNRLDRIAKLSLPLKVFCYTSLRVFPMSEIMHVNLPAEGLLNSVLGIDDKITPAPF
jgi:hypothetical protein